MRKVVLLISIFCAFLQAAVTAESCGPKTLEDVFLNIFAPDTLTITDLDNFVGLKIYDNIDQKKETVIYAYDFLEKSGSKIVDIIYEPFSWMPDQYNFLVLDYRRYVDNEDDNYIFDAIPNAIKKAKVFGEVLVDLHMDGRLNIERIVLIGFSLGAHVMGYVGRTVQEASNNTLKISKIVGLDPAGPAFYPLNPYVVALNKNDADYVQIIHTDSENFGIPVSTGHADFWPNGGKNQPNCTKFDKENIFEDENQCNHRRSVEYYAESVKSNSSFSAIKCDSWKSFQNQNCSEQQVSNQMGMNANTQLHGDFYLLTTEESID